MAEKPPSRLTKRAVHESPAEAVISSDSTAVTDLSASRAAKEAKAEVVASEKVTEGTATVTNLRAPVVREQVLRAPFSSYVEIELLARVNRHRSETGESRVALLDRGLRLALGDDLSAEEAGE